MREEGMAENERLRLVVERMVQGLHEAVAELRITEDELRTGLSFLTEVGLQDEFPLLSDVLGVSVLVDEMTHGQSDGAGTTTSVEGPFYKPGAPVLEPPYALASDDEPGEVLIVSGQVTDAGSGTPIEAAMLDVWQANLAGVYDTQDPSLGEFHLRGRMLTGTDGRYTFRTVVPPPYEIPKDGAVGALLRRLGRHAYRPAHLHLKVTADGYASLTTMVYFAGDPYLDSDTIGAVKDPLVIPLDRRDESAEPTPFGLTRPYWTCAFDISLRPTGEAERRSSTEAREAGREG
jgi:protocatechuate 3,4-dioxygenase beta subunit